jgi:hypothetical protein
MSVPDFLLFEFFDLSVDLNGLKTYPQKLWITLWISAGECACAPRQIEFYDKAIDFYANKNSLFIKVLQKIEINYINLQWFFQKSKGCK